MKATLRFELPEDQTVFELASQAPELKEALITFQTWLFHMRTQPHRKLDRRSLQAIEAEFKGIMADFNIELE